MSSAFEGLSPDDGRHYGDLVERAVAEGERAVAVASHGSFSDPAHRLAKLTAVANVRAQNATTAAVLAVAERLDVLIGCLFDERRPIAVVEVEESEPEDEEVGR